MRSPVRRYSWLSVLREARRFHTGWPPAWRRATPQAAYDIAIVGAGPVALALAYELARSRTAPRVLLLAGRPLGGMAGGGHAVLRSDRREAAAIRLFADARRRYRTLGAALDFNLGLVPRGLLSLALSEHALDAASLLAAAGTAAGTDTWMVPPREARSLLPPLAPDEALPAPLLGALWQPRAELVDGDAVVWGFARMAAAHGVDIAEDGAALALDEDGGRVVGVRTAAGTIAAGLVVLADAGGATLAGNLALRRRVRRVMRTEPVRPLVEVVVESRVLGGTLTQDRRGALLATFPAAATPWEDAMAAAGRLVTLMPALAAGRIARIETATAVVGRDGAPLLGPLGRPGLWGALGWDDGETAAAPAAGALLAESIATGALVPALAPFAAERFASGALLDERRDLVPA